MSELRNDNFGYFEDGRFYKNPHIDQSKLNIYFVTRDEFMMQYFVDIEQLPIYRTKSLTTKILGIEQSIYAHTYSHDNRNKNKNNK